MDIRLDHIGIAVNELDGGGKFWELLGLKQGRDETNDEQKVDIRFFETSPSDKPPKIELLAPTSDDSPIGKFLSKKGPGIQQVAFRVDDLDSLLAKLSNEGVRLINEEPTIGAGGSRIAFVHPSSTGGVLVELLEYDH